MWNLKNKKGKKYTSTLLMDVACGLKLTGVLCGQRRPSGRDENQTTGIVRGLYSKVTPARDENQNPTKVQGPKTDLTQVNNS